MKRTVCPVRGARTVLAYPSGLPQRLTQRPRANRSMGSVRPNAETKRRVTTDTQKERRKECTDVENHERDKTAPPRITAPVTSLFRAWQLGYGPQLPALAGGRHETKRHRNRREGKPRCERTTVGPTGPQGDVYGQQQRRHSLIGLALRAPPRLLSEAPPCRRPRTSAQDGHHAVGLRSAGFVESVVSPAEVFSSVFLWPLTGSESLRSGTH